MKVAVTAVSGKLGAEIAPALAATRGAESVVGLARTPKKARRLGIEVRPGDYDQPDQLATSLSGVDAVLLVSGMDAPAKRVQQHRNVIDAARSAGARKIVYTSIQGLEEGTGFSDVVQSNRQTEADVRASGLDWDIGRNGVYIEPDVEYIETYRERGEIANCADDGKCGYTTRSELGHAYARLLTEPQHDGQTYDLHGEPITQTELTRYLNRALAPRPSVRSRGPIRPQSHRFHRATGPVRSLDHDGHRALVDLAQPHGATSRDVHLERDEPLGPALVAVGVVQYRQRPLPRVGPKHLARAADAIRVLGAAASVA